MTGKIVLFRTVDSPTEAKRLASRLEASGIRVVLENAEPVALAGVLAGTSESVHVKVLADDYDDAEATLNESREYDEAESEEWQPSPDDFDEFPEEDDDADEEEESALDKDVRRAFKASIAGLIFWPIQAYTFYLIMKIGGDKRGFSPNLSPLYWLAILFCGLTLMIVSFVLKVAGLPLLMWI